MTRSVKDHHNVEFDYAVGLAIQDFRIQANMSQQRLADLTGRSRGGIINIEQGRQSVTLEQFLQFAEVLGLSPYTMLSAIEYVWAE